MPRSENPQGADSSRNSDWGPEELQREVENYAETLYDRHPELSQPLDLGRIEWSISRRLFRAGGYCRTEFGDPSVHEIVISYPAYRYWGWHRTQDIVRHELVHAAVFEAHGPEVDPHGHEFQALARVLDAPVEGERSLPYRFKLRCSACRALVDGLYEPSNRTRRPTRYRSGCCEAPLDVEEQFPTLG